jgi:hypothetical protein
MKPTRSCVRGSACPHSPMASHKGWWPFTVSPVLAITTPSASPPTIEPDTTERSVAPLGGRHELYIYTDSGEVVFQVLRGNRQRCAEQLLREQSGVDVIGVQLYAIDLFDNDDHAVFDDLRAALHFFIGTVGQRGRNHPSTTLRFALGGTPIIGEQYVLWPNETSAAQDLATTIERLTCNVALGTLPPGVQWVARQRQLNENDVIGARGEHGDDDGSDDEDDGRDDDGHRTHKRGRYDENDQRGTNEPLPPSVLASFGSGVWP